MAHTSQLEQLQRNGVVTLELFKNKRHLEVEGGCCPFQSLLLTKKEVGLLIKELAKIHRDMED